MTKEMLLTMRRHLMGALSAVEKELGNIARMESKHFSEKSQTAMSVKVTNLTKL